MKKNKGLETLGVMSGVTKVMDFSHLRQMENKDEPNLMLALVR